MSSYTLKLVKLCWREFNLACLELTQTYKLKEYTNKVLLYHEYYHLYNNIVDLSLWDESPVSFGLFQFCLLKGETVIDKMSKNWIILNVVLNWLWIAPNKDRMLLGFEDLGCEQTKQDSLLVGNYWTCALRRDYQLPSASMDLSLLF